MFSSDPRHPSVRSRCGALAAAAAAPLLLATVLGAAAGCSSPARDDTPRNPDTSAPPLQLRGAEAAAADEGEFKFEGNSSSRVVAWVNGEVVTYRDVLLEIQPQIDVLDDGAAKAELERRTIMDIVRDRILDGAAKEARVEVSRTELEEEISRRAKEIEGNGGTLEAYLHERGMTQREHDEKVRRFLRMQKYMLAAIGRGRNDVRVRAMTDTFVGPGEARTYYERHPERFQVAATARYRMLKVVPDFAQPDRDAAVATAEQIANQALARLKSGEDWVPVFREAQRGVTEPAPNDGYVEIGRGEASGWLEEFAFGSTAGDLRLERRGDVCYVLRSEGWEPAHTLVFDDIQEKIRLNLQDAKRWIATYEVELELLERSSVRPDELGRRIQRSLRDERRKRLDELGR